jgi:hypothetical protein
MQRMNREETAKVLTLISTHYWQDPKVENKDVTLMVETWTQALADIPLRPYIENALDWWFKHEKWPPQASDLRERAKMQMRAERDAHESAELLRRYAPLPARKMAPIAIRREAVRRLTAGEISGADLEREIERLVAESTGSHA